MSWSFSPVLVAAFLEGNSLDTHPYVQSSMTHTQDQFYWPDKPTEHSRLSRFGMTCELLTGDRGPELLTWFREGSRAKTFPLQGVEMDWKGSVVDSGGRWRESLAKYDPDSHSLKTAQLSLIEDWTGYSVTLPRSGLMLDGQCWELPMLGRITKGIESGYWLTPKATDIGRGEKQETFLKRMGDRTDRCAQSLPAQVANPKTWPAMAMWPTPTVCGNYNRKGASATSGDGLATAVKMWPTPTPTAHNAKETNAPSEALRNTPTLTAQVGGHLNPNWVEQLMGWPIGHTDLKPLGTGKYLNVEQQLGES